MPLGVIEFPKLIQEQNIMVEKVLPVSGSSQTPSQDVMLLQDASFHAAAD